MLEGLKQQYDWIKSVRQVLFRFMEDIPLNKLQESVPGYGHRTMIGTHIHAADSYLYWLGIFAGVDTHGLTEATPSEMDRANLQDVRDRFEIIDGIVGKFMDEFNHHWFENIVREVDWREKPLSLTPLFLLTHTETHEFHHRGQMVAMARHLGYPPDDRLGGLFS